MIETKYITFSRFDLMRFKTAFNAAQQADLDSFIFDGNEYLVAYAKYLIEYLEMMFGVKEKENKA